MRPKIFIFLCAFFLLVALANTSHAIAISESNGSISVDWTQLGENVTWADGAYIQNGADANNGLTEITDGYVNTPNAETAFGTNIVGTASTTTTSVYSSAYVYNDGSGYEQSASGTSHINRSFSVSTAGEYTFSVNYIFTDYISLSDSLEYAYGHHHACLSFWDGGIQESIVEAFNAGDENSLTGQLTITKFLDVETTYSFEIHTYNSVNAFSPFQESPAPVPEPATILLFGTGLIGLGGLRKKL